jgi:hypothetical protein
MMANATTGRNTHERASNLYRPQGTGNADAATKYYAGTMQGRKSTGELRNPAVANAATDRVFGVVKDDVDNTLGAAGDKIVELKRGIFKFAKDGTNPPTPADHGKMVFAVDNQTISRSAATGIPAGICEQVDSDGVWVDIDILAAGAPNAAA